MTSHDVVARLRKITGLKQIGHAGTLDPLATGVLPLALSSACRLLRFLPSGKIYFAEILLGVTTTTDDQEGDVVVEKSVDGIDVQSIKRATADLIGAQKQIPPAYSAVHHEGKRLYELARIGKLPDEIKSRDVNIEDIEILAINLPVVQVRIKCSSGTYIRSIARDLGEKLGCGACLKTLVREKSGPFQLEASRSLESLAELAKDGRFEEALISPEQVLGIDVISVDKEKARILSMGQYLPITSLSTASSGEMFGDKLCLVMFEHSLVALCAVTQDNRLHPEVVVRNAKSLA